MKDTSPMIWDIAPQDARQARQSIASEAPHRQISPVHLGIAVTAVATFTTG